MGHGVSGVKLHFLAAIALLQQAYPGAGVGLAVLDTALRALQQLVSTYSPLGAEADVGCFSCFRAPC